MTPKSGCKEAALFTQDVAGSIRELTLQDLKDMYGPTEQLPQPQRLFGSETRKTSPCSAAFADAWLCPRLPAATEASEERAPRRTSIVSPGKPTAPERSVGRIRTWAPATHPHTSGSGIGTGRFFGARNTHQNILSPSSSTFQPGLLWRVVRP